MEGDECLANMRKRDIIDTKAALSPPPKMMAVLKSISFILGHKKVSLADIKKKVLEVNLLDTLANYDKDQIDYTTCKKIYTLIKPLNKEDIHKVIP